MLMLQLGFGFIVTSTLLLHWHPSALITVMLMVTVGPDPAVQVICVVLLPAVMVPPVIDQL